MSVLNPTRAEVDDAIHSVVLQEHRRTWRYKFWFVFYFVKGLLR